MKHAGRCIPTNSLSSSLSPLVVNNVPFFPRRVSPVLASCMNKINDRERYHCRILPHHSPATLFTTYESNEWQRYDMPACSQPVVPGRSLFFPSPWIWEAACCLDFPSNPSLPFPISTLHLQRPALLTKWGNRIKWKVSCVSRSRHVVENYWPVCDFKIYLPTLSLERITLIKDIHPRTLLMISNIFTLTEHHGDWYNFSRFKGPFSNASHHGVGLLDEVSHCERLSAIKFTSARSRGGT